MLLFARHLDEPRLRDQEMRFGRDAVDGEDLPRASKSNSDGTLQLILVARANESCDTSDSCVHGRDDTTSDEPRQHRVKICRVFRRKRANAVSSKADRDCPTVVRIIWFRYKFCNPKGFELNVPRRTHLVDGRKNVCLTVRLTNNVEPGFAKGRGQYASAHTFPSHQRTHCKFEPSGCQPAFGPATDTLSFRSDTVARFSVCRRQLTLTSSRRQFVESGRSPQVSFRAREALRGPLRRTHRPP